MEIPASTYRLQLSPEFSFQDLQKISEYLSRFQISTVYSAPFFQSKEGSTHGYDVVDPLIINKAIGDLEQFREISHFLKQHRMNWLQDIVPNHMAFHPSNPWIHNIFEQGPQSQFYRFFDINWDYKEWKGKVMAPILGEPLEDVVQKGELKLQFDQRGFTIQYFEHIYPASVGSYSFVLSRTKEDAILMEWKEKLDGLSDDSNQWQEVKAGLIQAIQSDEALKNKLNYAVQELNGSRDLMQRLLNMQYFQPVHWKESEKKINFRRFFTINDLICLRMEDEKVFNAYHTFILQLCQEGLITGLRIDHIDGLFDPEGYLEKLGQVLGKDFYVVIEKILEWDEELPQSWATQGTSGYRFLSIVNNLFTASQNKSRFLKGYQQFNPHLVDYEQLIYDKKSFILHERMGGELQNLWELLQDLGPLPEGTTMTREAGIAALSAFLSAFPVYRIYPKDFPLSDREQKLVDEAYEKAFDKAHSYKKELTYLKDLFSGKAAKNVDKMMHFLQRCQQFTGPLAAKGVEDTAFYSYNLLISKNEVGDSPNVFGISIEDFHKLMIKRRQSFPLAINATATHDTKRGEDSRMRINVLSEMPDEWFQKVEEWQQTNKELKKKENVPDSNEEYFIYQTLLGAASFGNVMEEDFLGRTNDYLQKVLREAKVHSFWSDPDEAYEQQVYDFVQHILNHEPFRKSFDPFAKNIAFYGALNSLGQSLIKITAPGVPDIYQGSELWDLSYVDPDNRRPVDYDLRKKYLEEFESFPQEVGGQLQSMLENYKDGRIKMYTLYKALKERRLNQTVFEQGSYIPIPASDDHSNQVISFARHHEDIWYLVVVPVGVTTICTPESFPLGRQTWNDGALILSKEFPDELVDIYTGQTHSSKGSLELAAIFSTFPVAFLKSKGSETNHL